MTVTEDKTIQWPTAGVRLTLAINDNGRVCLRSLAPQGAKQTQSESQSPYFSRAELPLHSVRLAGEGSSMGKTAKSLVGSCISGRLRYESHQIVSQFEAGDNIERLDVSSVDAKSGLRVTQHFVVYRGDIGHGDADDCIAGALPVLRCWSTATNINTEGGQTLKLTQLSSATVGGLTTGGPREWPQEWTLRTATNTWFREAQWREQSLPDVGIDEMGVLGLNDNGGDHHCTQAIVSFSSRGSFSTGSYLPMGMLTRRDGEDTWFWQVENNGSWRWEIGDYEDAVYLCLGGPTAADHSWSVDLAPGQSVDSVCVAVGHVMADWQAAFGALTTYRRAMRRPHSDMDRCPIIFNDYMNCLMGDPDETKILALLDYAADAGAEYFVIDCGWYADSTSHWWDEVGLWEPSTKRFPSGFRVLLDKIRARGLIPGLWIEPEVVGVRSIVGQDGSLPEEAFFHDNGTRVIEKGRFQLDFRHEAVIARMNSIIDRLVSHYGAGYFKFDYNIEVIQGTDVPSSIKNDPSTSPEAAHLDHHRAYLAWVRSLLERYPNLVIESCSSGGQRCDYAMLSVHPLHSTSDQQDPVLYAAIAAAAPTAVTPEQGAVWAYPQPNWDDETNALTVANCLLGRAHLSGHLDLLTPDQSALVRDGMRVYADIIRGPLRTALPFWPVGLPRWNDEWAALGMLAAGGNVAFLTVWRRGKKITGVGKSVNGEAAGTIDLPLPRAFTSVDLLYPDQLKTEYALFAQSSVLQVTLTGLVGARVFYLKK
ncbi:hypothetical protein SBRCBS47491_009354 [Sporothrix bragantina]|uniref:alpha-galactosidase n=1 Tax=Sporothrix bragantina TaxID=671064 RepID=A0ABP0CU86_9PEZI